MRIARIVSAVRYRINFGQRRLSPRLQSNIRRLLRYGLTIALLARTVTPAAATIEVLHNFFSTNGLNPTGGLVAFGGNFYGEASYGGPTGNGVIFKMTPAGAVTPFYSFNGTEGRQPTGGLIVGADGNFYGVTSADGDSTSGIVFKLTPAGQLTTMAAFDGAHPVGRLLQASDGNFYGATRDGGTHNQGTVYRLTPNGQFSTMVQFTGPNGSVPYAGLIEAEDGDLYGTTYVGGASDAGTIFRLNIQTGQLTTLVSFDGVTALRPATRLLQASDGNFYGTTNQTCYTTDCGYGTVFRMTPAGDLNILVNFQIQNGGGPEAALVEAGDGSLYGTTAAGGNPDDETLGGGTVFRVTRSGELTILKRFISSDDAVSPSELIDGGDGSFYGTSSYGGSSSQGTAFKTTSNGTFTYLSSFQLERGSRPTGGFRRSSDGITIGATSAGGRYGMGSLFRLNADQTLTSFASFEQPTTGSHPIGAPVEGVDGNFYGTTESGGPVGYGTVYRATPTGEITVLSMFDSDNSGYLPNTPLILGLDNNFYGTTAYGGSSGGGTIFKVTASGTFSTLASFAGENGSQAPNTLIQGVDGNLYGTTRYGGLHGYGTVFKLSPNGELTTLVSFNGFDGGLPLPSLIQTSDGSLYGYSEIGCNGHINCSSIYKVAPDGELSNVANFPEGVQGASRLVLAADGNFYGTAQSGSAGSIFQLTPSGTLTTLETFDGSTNGYPMELMLTDDGYFYGMTVNGGTAGLGTIYRALSPSVPPPDNGGGGGGGDGGGNESDGGGGGAPGTLTLIALSVAAMTRRRYPPISIS